MLSNDYFIVIKSQNLKVLIIFLFRMFAAFTLSSRKECSISNSQFDAKNCSS